MKGHIRACLISAVAIGLVVMPTAAGADAPSYSGRYECTEVLEGDTVVSMTFTLWIVSHRDQDVVGGTVSLLDASHAGVVYAEFPSLSLTPGVDVPLTATVSLDREEWDRWRLGARPRVRLEAYDVDGTDLSEMVDLVQISSPEVLQ